MDYGGFILYDGDSTLSAGGELAIGVRDEDTTGNKVVRIDRGASANILCIVEDNVGIGTTDPTDTLHVKGFITVEDGGSTDTVVKNL